MQLLKMWVFGLADSSHTPALGYMEVVPDHRTATLLPLTQAHAASGTIIHSDEWSGYCRAGRFSNGSAHETVNHSIEFVDSTTRAHTQSIESYWNRSKIN